MKHYRITYRDGRTSFVHTTTHAEELALEGLFTIAAVERLS